ncbi:hypothetical protein BOTBODRAFT_554947 [Botryobasidium botryosum FD-172 SS1]|uniref:Elongator complex protein 5 n=1 Tax=Botryobasidium botryosum (strain FD-172 SS1) TaxID=930990 RepID=A0A067N3D5_BOTB1|nr:hypothetical protein BOTBODRAFT_554947 [Botryobasidium botryosum FD-172 SS1]
MVSTRLSASDSDRVLPSVLANAQKPHHPLVLIQNDLSQPFLPIFRHMIHSALNSSKKSTVILLSLNVHPLDYRLENTDALKILDWTVHVPGFGDDGVEWRDPRPELLNAIQQSPAGSLNVFVDSADTLVDDAGSVSELYKFLKKVLSLIQERPSPSRLVLPLSSSSQLLPLLLPSSFSQTLTHITLHSPALLASLSESYLTPPPPYSPPEKFWSLFIPTASRREGERLGMVERSWKEGVAEICIREKGARKGIVRVLEGWKYVNTGGGVVDCAWDELDAMKVVVDRLKGGPRSAGVTQSLSFNLNLTPAQQEARSMVPLPYAHEGEQSNTQAIVPGAGHIFYDPDSADDMDDEDPDEDLDI